MRKQLVRLCSTHKLNAERERIASKDHSSDDTIGAAASRFTVLIGGGFSGASVLEDNAVGAAATGFTVLVGGDRSRKNNAVEGVHVCWLCLCSCCDAN